jgi:hypothetical protein
VTEPLAGRLNTALSGRYALERQLGQGGMAIVFWPTTSTDLILVQNPFAKGARP